VPTSLGVVLALGLSVFQTIAHQRHAYFDSALMLLMFLLAGLAAFLWALRNGQFDDLDGAAWRAISDDDLQEDER
jgi:cbb3-type cytochrome oxidase maturation protein